MIKKRIIIQNEFPLRRQTKQKYLLVKILPVVLSHQSEQGKEGPAKGIKACVAIIWIGTCFHTDMVFWTLPEMHTRDSDCQKLTMQLLLENHVWREDKGLWKIVSRCLPSITAFPTDHRIFLSWLDIIITYSKKKNTIHKRTYTKLRCIHWFVQ